MHKTYTSWGIVHVIIYTESIEMFSIDNLYSIAKIY